MASRTSTTSSTSKRRSTLRQAFSRFWPYTRGDRRLLALGAAVTVASVPVEALAIYLFKVLVDEVLQPARFAPFPRIAAAYLAITLVLGGLSFVSGLVLATVGERFVLALRTGVFAHLHGLSVAYYDDQRLGDLLNRLEGDVEAVESVVVAGLSQVIGLGLQVVVFTGMMVVLDPPLALAALVVSPLLWLLGRTFAGRLKAAAVDGREAADGLMSVAEESLAGVGLVQAYNQQRREVDRFAHEGRRAYRAALRSARLHGLYGPLVSLVELTGLMIVIGYGTWQLGHGVVGLGALLAFLAYFAQMYEPLRGLGQLSTTAFAAAAGAERIGELLDARPAVLDPRVPAPRPVGADVEFRDVSFTYPGRSAPALEGVSFTVRAGQFVAVVGRSGSGKSTLGRLLLRFHDPSDGAIRLGGSDLRDLRGFDVREHVAGLLQETLILDGTVRENIRWGRPEASDADLAAAVRDADLDQVLADLPDGLDTVVGYRGRSLSGGQRQRIAIARAMLRGAPVLLLDEPATGLDPASERAVMVPLTRLMTGRTTILITHNLAVAQAADLIVVVDRGRVVERGAHADLMARGGVYHALWTAQHAFAAVDPLPV